MTTLLAHSATRLEKRGLKSPFKIVLAEQDGHHVPDGPELACERLALGDLGADAVPGFLADVDCVDAIDLVGEDDNPLAPLRVVLVH